MFRSLCRLIFTVGFLWLATSADSAETVPEWWSRLALRDLEGAPVRPAGRWIVVVFLSPECPVANAAIPVLNALATEFSPHGFAFIGAYADPSLATAELRRHAQEHGLRCVAGDDRGQRLTHVAGASYTPEVVVFARDGRRLYRGRIDDRVTSFGPAKPAATQEDLRTVLMALTKGESGPFPDRPGFGCAMAEPVQR